ncbi:MAG: hypothetical protein ACT4P1_04010 [Sporichthyaceae bacterium]
MQTTIRVAKENRDQLAAVAAEMGGVSLDEALEALLFERTVQAQYATLMADPQAYADYLAENRTLVEVDIAVRD